MWNINLGDVIAIYRPKLMDPFYRRNGLFLIPVVALLFCGILAGIVVAAMRATDGP